MRNNGKWIFLNIFPFSTFPAGPNVSFPRQPNKIFITHKITERHIFFFAILLNKGALIVFCTETEEQVEVLLKWDPYSIQRMHIVEGHLIFLLWETADLFQTKWKQETKKGATTRGRAKQDLNQLFLMMNISSSNQTNSSTNKQNFQFTEKIFTRMKFLFRYDGIIEEEGWAVEGGLKMEKNCII